jgi:peptide/nickel transport system ATP-binding protein
MGDALLEIQDLKVVYRTGNETVHAVNNVNFTLRQGETLGIVGETGAGKTTTALSILRLLPEKTGIIEKGAILFRNRNLVELKSADMQALRGEMISMIFQDPMTALNPTLTVGAQIAEALILHNEKKRSRHAIEKRVDDVLELVGIPASRKREYPHQFSGGMKQRVVIAIALACEPELLIADEPTTALDVTIQAQVLAMMADLREKLTTSMIMITHDLGVVAQICDIVAVMYAGEIIEFGTLEDIFTGDFHHPYTLGLFNSLPNIEGDTDRLQPINGLMPDPTNLPAGCKFSPRCPQCMQICTEEEPGTWIDGVHRISCHLYTDKGVC